MENKESELKTVRAWAMLTNGKIDFDCHFYEEYPNEGRPATESWIELEIRPWKSRPVGYKSPWTADLDYQAAWRQESDENKELKSEIIALRRELDYEKNRIKRVLTTDGKGSDYKAELLAGLLAEIHPEKPLNELTTECRKY